MASCAHHLADCRDRNRAAKRGGGKTPIPFGRVVADGRYLATIDRGQRVAVIRRGEPTLKCLAFRLDLGAGSRIRERP